MNNIDTLKIHHLNTQVDHADYIRYRTAIKNTGMSSSAFLRTLITVGLNEVVSIAKKSNAKATLEQQLSDIQTQLDALNGSASTPQMSPSGRFARGSRETIIRDFLSLNPMASAREMQRHLANLRGTATYSLPSIYQTMKKMGLQFPI